MPNTTNPPGPSVDVSVGALRTIDFHSPPVVCRIDENSELSCYGPKGGEPSHPHEGKFVSFVLSGDFSEGHGCGLGSDGSVQCWQTAVRRPDDPLCGTGVAVPCSNGGVPPAAHYESIAGGFKFSCGVTDTGAIQCWGLDNEFGLATSPSGTDFTAVECSSTCCGLRKSGEVHCWGELEFQAQPLSEPAVQMVLIGTNRCLLMQSGRVQCVGPDPPAPAPTGTSFVRVSGGGQSNWRRAMCGLSKEGAIQCWGSQSLERITPPPGPYRESANSTEDACGLRGDGKMECWGLHWGNGGGDETCRLTEARLAIGGGAERLFHVGQQAWGTGSTQSAPAWSFATALVVGEYPDQNEAPFVLISGASGLERSLRPPYEALGQRPIALTQSIWAPDATATSAGTLLCSGPDSGSTVERNDDELVFDAKLATLGSCPGTAVAGELRWGSMGLTGSVDGIAWSVTNFRGVSSDVHFADGSYLKLQPSSDRSTSQWGLLVTSPSSPYGGRVFCIGEGTSTGSNDWALRNLSSLGSCPTTSTTTLTGCVR